MVLYAMGFESSQKGVPGTIYRSPAGSYSIERLSDDCTEVRALIFKRPSSFINKFSKNIILRVGSKVFDSSTVVYIDLDAKKVIFMNDYVYNFAATDILVAEASNALFCQPFESNLLSSDYSFSSLEELALKVYSIGNGNVIEGSDEIHLTEAPVFVRYLNQAELSSVIKEGQTRILLDQAADDGYKQLLSPCQIGSVFASKAFENIEVYTEDFFKNLDQGLVTMLLVKKAPEVSYLFKHISW